MRDYRSSTSTGSGSTPARQKTLDVINPATEASRDAFRLAARPTWTRGRRRETRLRVVTRRRRARSASRCSRRSSRSTRRGWTTWHSHLRGNGRAVAKVAKPHRRPPATGHFMVAARCSRSSSSRRRRASTGDRARTGRCVRADHAVELACQPDRLQGGPRARHRLHDGAEAKRDSRRSRRTSSPRSCTKPACRKACSTWSNGDGPTVGAAISSHPGIDMVSFTGSTRAGILVDKAAADTVKKVALELGGKSPNVILEGSPLPDAVGHGVMVMMNNTGQSCNAPSRMLVPRKYLAEVEAIAAAVASQVVRRRSGRRGDRHGPAGEPATVAPCAGPDREGHRRRERKSSVAERVDPTVSRAATSRNRRSSATCAMT